MKKHTTITKLTINILLIAFAIMNLSPLFSIKSSALTTNELNTNGVDSQGLLYSLDGEAGTAEVSGPYDIGTFSLQAAIIPDCVTKDTIIYTVTSIGKNAFKDCTSITSITIPDNLSRIGRDAFLNTAWFNSLENGLIYIGNVIYAYKGKMPDETEIILPEGISVIADYAFYKCGNLISLTVPTSVKNIGYGAFFYCDRLTSIKVESGNTYYSSDVYGVLYNKSKSILIQYTMGNTNSNFSVPSGVKSINEKAFYYCANLTSISFPEGMLKIGKSSFEGCDGLTKVKLPETLTSIGAYAFYYCSELTSIIIPESVTAIDEDVFHNCPKIVLYVYDGSFAHQYALSSNLAYQFLIDYKITLIDGYATGIMDKQSVMDIIKKLPTAVVKNSSGTTITGDTIVGTGSVIFINGKSYIVIIKGDLNGDGKVEAKDYMLTKRAYLKTFSLSVIQLKASCFENTALPTAKDYLKIKRHFLGTFNMYA